MHIRRKALPDSSRCCSRRWRQRLSQVRKSEVLSVKRACCWSACGRCSTGRSRGSWIDRAAAMTSTSRTTPSRSASRIIRPRRGSIGSRASRCPTLVEPAAAPVRDRAELLQQLHAVGDVALVGRLDEREPPDVAEPQRRHLQDDRGEVGAQDLGVGEHRPRLVVLLGVETDRDAGLDAAAPARALVGPTPG